MEALPIVKYRQRRTGGVISPLLANLSLHFTLDVWLSKHCPQVNFVRYADDVVVHCTSRTEAEEVLEATKRRLAEVKLQIKEEKRRQELHSIYSRNKPNQPEANTGSNQRGKTLN